MNNQVEIILNTYIKILEDISMGENLLIHLKDINEAISELNKTIEIESKAGRAVTGYEELEKQLYFLKMSIDKQI